MRGGARSVEADSRLCGPGIGKSRRSGGEGRWPKERSGDVKSRAASGTAWQQVKLHLLIRGPGCRDEGPAEQAVDSDSDDMYIHVCTLGAAVGTHEERGCVCWGAELARAVGATVRMRSHGSFGVERTSGSVRDPRRGSRAGQR